jgi:hypothetical protein
MRKTDEITNVDIVVYALATLGGAERTVSSEVIAAKSHELAPARFSWRRPEYREKGWPDKYIAKTSLEDAKKRDYGSLVEGVYALDLSKDGWMLTPEGAKWYRENRERIESALKVRQTIVPRKHADRFKRHVRAQSLFVQFVSTRSVDAEYSYAFTDMLNCSPDASPEVVALKFRRMKAMAELIQDPDITAFLTACEASFPHLSSDAKEDTQQEIGSDDR